MNSITRVFGFGVLCMVATVGAGHLSAQEDKPAPGDSRAAATAFLKQYVIGKTVTCSITNKIPAEAIETTFERRSSFANLTESKAGFTFDEHYVVMQVIYDLDTDGKRIGKGRKVDRWGVMRYQIMQRKSVATLMGTRRIESTSEDDYVGSTDAVTIEFVSGNLVITSSTIGVTDHFAAKGMFKAGFTETRTTYRMEKSALYRDQIEKNYNVDLKSSKKELVGDPVKIQDVPAK